MARAGQFGQLWDLLAQGASTELPTRRWKLELSPEQKTELPHIQRSLGLIPDALRKTLRSLIDGDLAWPLYLFGPIGTGKSYAGLCLCDVSHGRFWTHDTLCDSILDDQMDTWQQVRSARLAVLDDVGTRSGAGDLQYMSLIRFWEEREVQHQRTVYTSNLEPEELERLFDLRICSRLLCGTIFTLGGKDRR